MKGFTALAALLAVLLTFCACSVQKIGTDNNTQAPGTEGSPPTKVSDNAELSSNTGGNDGSGSALPEPADTSDTHQSAPLAALYNMTHSEPGVREDYSVSARYEDDMSQGRDLCVLGAFPSIEATLSGKNMGEIWSSCLRQNSLSDSLRPGFLLEFDTPDGHCSKLILRPSDITDAYWDYIETYIYDDIHQTPGAWYSHLLDSEFTDETIVTSVKITAGERISEVRSLTLSVFLYDVGDRADVDEAYARQNGFKAEIIPNPARK